MRGSITDMNDRDEKSRFGLNPVWMCPVCVILFFGGLRWPRLRKVALVLYLEMQMVGVC